MRPGIVSLLLLTVLVGCGDAEAPPEEPAAGPPYTLVAVLSESAAGGDDVSDVLQALDSHDKLVAFAGRFTPSLAQRILDTAKATEVPDDKTLAGAVVYVGCGAPETFTVEERGKDWVAVPGPTNDENIECFAAVTSVALAVVPIEG